MQHDALVGSSSSSSGGGADGGGGDSGGSGSGGSGGGGSGDGGGLIGERGVLGLRELKWGQAVLLSRAHAGTGKPLALVSHSK